jgi:hypothetical protein
VLPSWVWSTTTNSKFAGLVSSSPARVLRHDSARSRVQTITLTVVWFRPGLTEAELSLCDELRSKGALSNERRTSKDAA